MGNTCNACGCDDEGFREKEVKTDLVRVEILISLETTEQLEEIRCTFPTAIEGEPASLEGERPQGKKVVVNK